MYSHKARCYENPKINRRKKIVDNAFYELPIEVSIFYCTHGNAFSGMSNGRLIFGFWILDIAVIMLWGIWLTVMLY